MAIFDLVILESYRVQIHPLTAVAVRSAWNAWSAASAARCWRRARSSTASPVTYGWIRNSIDIGTLALSENLLDEINANPLLEILGEPREFPFDDQGDLPQCGEFLGIGEPAHAH